MTSLARIRRFRQAGITVVRICPTILDITAPTRAELTGGTIITGHIRQITGFGTEGERTPTPDYGSPEVGTISGDRTLQDSALGCYASRDGIDIRSVLAESDLTYVVMQDGGDVEDYPMDVFEVEVNTISKERDRSAPYGVMISFDIQVLAKDVATPAKP